MSHGASDASESWIYREERGSATAVGKFFGSKKIPAYEYLMSLVRYDSPTIFRVEYPDIEFQPENLVIRMDIRLCAIKDLCKPRL